ncbi:transporter substrate-binding domain-containing protein [Kiloniella laminariae]|uniref:Transporter substrate-binding domain-containing protein n=1 Tax=Kiloniella laminariae TaxID=454162 RepID=A0ABT4LDW0_9PROT|nr:transporter substrate-binding domain-containing protein [Kiloniella laminariae]MCZ4279276.1 transporter substrate-binding domain-containing protein [Kiloniella laminariae]
MISLTCLPLRLLRPVKGDLISAIALVILLVSPFPTSAQDLGEVELLGKQIPVYLDDPEASVFGKVVSSIRQESQLDLALSILPPQRASKLFASGKGDILIPYPLNQKNVKTPGQELGGAFVASKSLAMINRHVLTLSNKNTVSSPEDMKGMKVGISLGYAYGNLEEIDGIRLISATNQTSLVKMLYSERVDAIVSFPFEAQIIARNLALGPMPWFDPDYVLSRSSIVMLFRDTARGIILQSRINGALEKLRQRGDLEMIAEAFEAEQKK